MPPVGCHRLGYTQLGPASGVDGLAAAGSISGEGLRGPIAPLAPSRIPQGGGGGGGRAGSRCSWAAHALCKRTMAPPLPLQCHEHLNNNCVYQMLCDTPSSADSHFVPELSPLQPLIRRYSHLYSYRYCNSLRIHLYHALQEVAQHPLHQLHPLHSL